MDSQIENRSHDIESILSFSGFSEYWRKNKSYLEARELAHAIRALRKVGSYITSNVKSIEWVGMPDDEKGKILVDPSFIMGQYPIPPEKMDVLVGYVAHEAFHCKELSDFVLLRVEDEIEDLNPAYREHLLNFIGIGEDIYISKVTQDSVWQNYIRDIWGKVRTKQSDTLLPPIPAGLLQIWERIVLRGERDLIINPDYEEALNILITFGKEMNNMKIVGSPLDRSSRRIQRYLEMWEIINRFFIDWEYVPPFEDGVGIQDERGRKEICEPDEEICEEEMEICHDESEEEQEEEKTISPELKNQIEEILHEGIEKCDDVDITEPVRVVCGDEAENFMETVFCRSTMRIRAKPESELVKRLQEVFKLQRQRSRDRFRVNKGLYSGKLDGRRLYRAPVNGRIFKRKENYFFEDMWNIAILVDASESMKGGVGGMGGREWWVTETTFASLYEAAKGSGNTLDLICYHESGSRCEIIRLVHDDMIYTVLPSGRTPSGQAIIGCALKLPKNKRRLIIHITDGEPNCGISVDYALEYCERENIDLITIGCSYKDDTKEQFQQQYKESLYLMDSIEELPTGLETLLRLKLLGRRLYNPYAPAQEFYLQEGQEGQNN